MAVVRSLFGRFSEHASRNKDAQRDHKSQGNLVCLRDNDRVAEAPKLTAPQFTRAPQFTGDMLGSFHNDHDHDRSASEAPPSTAPQFTDHTLETLHNDPSIPAEKFSFGEHSIPSEKFSFDDPGVATEKFSLGHTSVPTEKFSFGQDIGKDLGENFSENLDQDFGDTVEQTLGQLMTQAREHRGLSREQVAAETRIPPYYVRMIESDSYDAIPDQLYLLPFFRRYAIFFGLDEHKIVARFIREFEKAENEIVDIKTTQTTKTANTIKTTKEPPHLKAQDSKAPEVKVWRQIAIAVLIVGALQTFLPRGIAMMRSTLHHTADASSPVTISENTLPPSTIQAEDSPRLLNDAAPVLSDAQHPSNDAPQISNEAPQPVAAIQPADTSAAAAPSSAITTASTTPNTKHHRHHAHDATLLSNDALPASDTPSLVPSLANDAPHPSSAAPQVSNAAPQPVADIKPAETPAAAAPSPAVTTASIAPHSKHHRHHAHTPPQSNDATAPSDDALRPTYEELHPVSDAPNASSDTAPSPNDAWRISNDVPHAGDASHLSHPSNDAAPQPAATETPAAATPSPAITTASATTHTKHHRHHAHSHKLTHNTKHSSKPTT